LAAAGRAAAGAAGFVAADPGAAAAPAAGRAAGGTGFAAGGAAADGAAAAGAPSLMTLVGEVALRSPVAELVSLVVAVCCAVGLAGFGAASVGATPVCAGAADAPAAGESVRDTSPFNGSPGALLAGLSAAAVGGVAGSGDFVGSSAI
jgi:hypothetical protein